AQGSAKTTKSGVDGFCYYEDSTLGRVYFDANGYRYTLVDGAKNYIDDTSAAAPTVSSFTITSLDPAKIDQAYKMEIGKAYRVGFAITKSGSQVTYTIYIKQAGAETWEKCIGTSTQTLASDTKIALTGSNTVYLGGKMEAYTYTCSADQHMPGMSTSARKVSADGVVYYETSCDWCGVDSVTSNGVAYTGTVVNNQCEGSYTLWTSTENASDTFKTDVVAGAHNFSGAQCTVCKAYAYFVDFPIYSNGSVKGPTYGTKDYNGDGSTISPAYSPAKGYVDAPESGMILRILESGVYNFASPFVASVDVCLDGAISSTKVASSPSKDQAWPLLEYRSGIDGISAYGTLVGVYTERDADGNAIGDPWLVLNRDGGKKLCQLSYGEYYHISASADPVTKTFTVYVNGECVGNGTFVYTTNANSGQVAVGVQTFNEGYYVFAYKVKNVSFVPVTVENMFGGAGSNTILNLDFAEGLEGGRSTNSRNNAFGSHTVQLGLGDSANERKGDFAVLYGSSYREITISHGLGENLMYTLNDKKYEILLDFAVPKTDVLSAGEKITEVVGGESKTTLVPTEGADGKIDALQYDFHNKTNISNTQNLIRLSKFNDPIKSELLQYTVYGGLKALGYVLCFNNTLPASILVDFDENGVPMGSIEVRAIIDEVSNTYSIYLNGAPAYYYHGGEFLPFVDMPLPCEFGNVTGVETFGEVTKEMAEAAGYTGNNHYVRLFRNMNGVAVRRVAITLIPDSNVELVGTQTRTADSGAANGTFDLRFIFGVDDIFKQAVGFNVTAYDVNGNVHNTWKDVTTDTIYTAVKSGNDVLHAYECNEGEYLTTLKILGITETSAADRYVFEITAYVVDATGTKLPSPVTYVVTCDGLGQNVVTSYK
ncbi:MAG: hypothetical protein IKV00_02645, partial [Clostridia bacterium]|nr:hypothetical protein [Clostridia bacterium]